MTCECPGIGVGDFSLKVARSLKVAMRFERDDKVLDCDQRGWVAWPERAPVGVKSVLLELTGGTKVT